MVVISFVNMADWHAMARHRQRLPAEGVREMVLAAIEMLGNSDNDLGNRVSLVRGLMELCDVLDEPGIDAVFNALDPIARGLITEPPGRKSHPLDVGRLKTKTPADLQGIALVGLARVGARRPKHFREQVGELLEEAFSDSQVEVRRGAFAAFRDLPGQSEGALLAVLLGTRDSDPSGAVTALAALAEKRDLVLNRNHWRLLLYSIRLAGRSTSSNLRRQAAATLARLIGRSPGGSIRAQADEVLRSFTLDICASVREATQFEPQVIEP
jgi:hypothetical protein